MAEAMLGEVQDMAIRYPTAYSAWLCATSFAIYPVQEVAILGDLEEPQTQAMLEVLWQGYRPFALAAISPFPPPPNAPALLQDRPMLNSAPTAYVCQHFICQQPVNSPDELAAQLK